VASEAAHLFIALYTDADVHGRLAAQIRRRGFDALSAYEAGNATLDDEDQLEYAASQRRAILTCNARHFAPLFEKWWETGRKHYGVIVSEQIPLGEMLRRVIRLLNTVNADEMENGYRDLAEFAERRSQPLS
jgi:hypothetical protein